VSRRRSAGTLAILALLAAALAAAGAWALLRATPGAGPAPAAPTHVAAQVDAVPRHVGSAACAECHADETARWTQSHHRAAIQVATPATVLGEFDDTRFTHGGVTTRFFRRDGDYFVETDAANGSLRVFRVSHTFGVDPLQQYLLELPDGRRQALSVSWDTRPAAEGGQRWYHLYPEPVDGVPVDHRHPLHWTGALFNWNSRCASCHGTDVDKGYDAGSDRYDTRWSELSVGCEACHGPGSRHVQWAREGEPPAIAHQGFARRLGDRGSWAPASDSDLADGWPAGTLRRTDRGAGTEVLACARCHSRREELAAFDGDTPYFDAFVPALLRAPVYEADGQVQEEAFEYGSFVQSRMHRAGVTCSDCHDPHSGQLRAPGNGVCAQCHQPAVYDVAAHHRHPEGSAAAQCVACHMPATTFMGVDVRHDHGFRVPQPELSVATGVRNPCTDCHREQSAAWAAEALAGWIPERAEPLWRTAYTLAFAAADAGRAGADAALLEIALDARLPPIVRGSAGARLGDYVSNESAQGLQALLGADDPLLRLGAIQAVAEWPSALRWRMLQPHLAETLPALRVAMGGALAAVDPAGLAPAESAAVRRLHADFLAAQRYNADYPEAQVLLGNFHGEHGEAAQAEAAYRQALRLAPGHEGALLNLADLYRQTGRDAEAEPLLREAIARHPRSAAPHYVLALLEVRRERIVDALASLRRAVALAPDEARYAYTYALALERDGRAKQGIAHLEAWIREHGEDPELAAVLAQMRQRAGR
jgi:predicted CXXCH cytochrome family protein